MKTLAQLRAEQQASGVKAEVNADGVAVGSPTVYTNDLTGAGKSQLPVEPGVPVASGSGGKLAYPPNTPGNTLGYLRILPPEFSSVAQATPAWQAEFWSGPSPWCRVEGLPDHEEFEKNLLAFEVS